MNIDLNFYKMDGKLSVVCCKIKWQFFKHDLTILAIIELENDVYIVPPYNHVDIYDLHQLIIWIKSRLPRFAYDLW